MSTKPDEVSPSEAELIETLERSLKECRQQLAELEAKLRRATGQDNSPPK